MFTIAFLMALDGVLSSQMRQLKKKDNMFVLGLVYQTDPGVPVVYAGFGALMLTTCISYLSHSQIWALQNGTTLVVGGRTNRAKNEFPDDMNRLLDQVPELIKKTLVD